MEYIFQSLQTWEIDNVDENNVNINLVQYLLQIDIQKRTEKIQWKKHYTEIFHLETQTGKTSIYYIHTIVLHCLQYNIHIGASGIQNPNPMTWISPKP